MVPKKILLLLSVYAVFGLSCGRAVAAEITVERNVIGENYLIISGKIALEDAEAFLRISRASKAKLVFLESPGGSIRGAVAIGEIVKSRQMSTIVAEGDYCASACGLIWLAGERRILTEQAKVGFHTTFVIVAGTRLRSEKGNAYVDGYLNRLNLTKQNRAFVTSADPWHLNWLNTSNAREFGVFPGIVQNESDRTKISIPKTQEQGEILRN